MRELALFFAGVFLCNSIPHLVSGLRGELFPTPFAKPSHEGPSSPLVNFLWGALNFIIGALLLGANSFSLGFNFDTLVAFGGAVVLGAQLSVHFGKVRN